jgi:hypothetical protein
MKTTIFLFLMSLCIESLGAIIFIKGQPTPLTFTNELYYLPMNFSISPGTTNLFITMDGMNKLCFLNTSPPGMLEQISEINIVINGVITDWNCFPYKTTILEVRP